MTTRESNTDPSVAAWFDDERVDFQVEWLTAELAVWKAEQKRRREEAHQAEVAKNPYQLDDLVWTQWDIRQGRAGHHVIGLNPKSVLVYSAHSRHGERVPLNRIVKATRDGVDLVIEGVS